MADQILAVIVKELERQERDELHPYLGWLPGEYNGDDGEYARIDGQINLRALAEAIARDL